MVLLAKMKLDSDSKERFAQAASLPFMIFYYLFNYFTLHVWGSSFAFMWCTYDLISLHLCICIFNLHASLSFHASYSKFIVVLL